MDIREKIKKLIEQGARIIVISKNGLKADITEELEPAILEFKTLKNQYYESLTRNRELEQQIDVLVYNLEELRGNKPVRLDKQLDAMIDVDKRTTDKPIDLSADELRSIMDKLNR